MVNDVNNLDMMVRLIERDRVIKFDFVRRAALESNDPKLWDMFEILNRKHLYRIRTPEDMTADIVFSEDRLAEAEPLRRIEKVIRDFRDQDLRFDVRCLFRKPGTSTEES